MDENSKLLLAHIVRRNVSRKITNVDGLNCK